MNDIFILKNEQINKHRLGGLKKRGIIAKPTDYALTQGLKTNDLGYGPYFIFEHNRGLIYRLESDGKIVLSDDSVAYVRPVLKYSSIDKNQIREVITSDGVIKIEYGDYPQSVAPNEIQKELNYYDDVLSKTGNYYNISINPKYNYEEYIYEGKKYVCAKVYDDVILSNGYEYKKGSRVWIQVEPVKFLVDKRSDLIVSEKLLFLKDIANYMDKDYVSLSAYLNNNFKKDLFNWMTIENNIKSEDITTSYHLNSKFSYPEEINKYGMVLNENNYKYNPAIGRDEEIKDLEKNLLIPKKGVILVGKPGVGKTSIVEGLTYRIQNDLVCKALKNKVILSSSISNLVAGCKYRGDFEEKIDKLCNIIANNPNVILFLDEIHNSIGTGSTNDNKLDLANILKPYISNKTIKVIGCTTDYEIDNIKNDLAFIRRFNLLEVKELDDRFTKEILKQMIYSNEFGIDVKLSEYKLNLICDIIIKLSKRKLKYTYNSNNNPDASINILDYCLAYLALYDIENPTFNDFINGIKDNKNLSLSELDTYLLKEHDIDYDKERSKIKIHN